MPERKRKLPFPPSPCTYYQQLQPLSKYRERSEKTCPQGLLPLFLPHIISCAKKRSASAVGISLYTVADGDGLSERG